MDLDIHEKTLILEGLIRVRQNGLEMAAMQHMEQDTREIYLKDAAAAEALNKKLRAEWWGYAALSPEQAP